MTVHVSRHVRRRKGKLPGYSVPASAAVSGPHWNPAVRPELRRPPSTLGSLGAIIDDVVEGRRSGYTWTGRFRFDVDDHASMERFYDRLGPLTAYVIAFTNRRLQDTDFGKVTIVGHKGVGLWRDETGQVFADDIGIFTGLTRDEALGIAAQFGQRYILRLDGATRKHEFIEVAP